jgi:hypothetical protein
MPTILVFDPNANPQRVTHVSGPSENQGAWTDSGRTDFLVDPSLAAVAGVPQKYWKHVVGEILPYTQAEKDTKDAADAAAATAALRASAEDYFAGTLSNSVTLRALADVIKDEINTLRAFHSLAPRTMAQLKTAILNRIQSGTVDT